MWTIEQGISTDRKEIVNVMETMGHFSGHQLKELNVCKALSMVLSNNTLATNPIIGSMNNNTVIDYDDDDGDDVISIILYLGREMDLEKCSLNFIFNSFLVGLGFELRALNLQSRSFTA
jgi:hypothetical protein